MGREDPIDDYSAPDVSKALSIRVSPEGGCIANGVVRGGKDPTALYRQRSDLLSARVSFVVREWYWRATSGPIISRPSAPIRMEVRKPRRPRNLLAAAGVRLLSCSA